MGSPCNQNCNPGVGCIALQSIREELAEHNLDQAQASARLDVAAGKAEVMVKAFGDCLKSVEAHTLTLNDGRHEMKRLDKDVTKVAEVGRTHAQKADGTLATHRGLEKSIRERFKRTNRNLSLVGTAVIILYVVFAVSPMRQTLFDSISKLMRLG